MPQPLPARDRRRLHTAFQHYFIPRQVQHLEFSLQGVFRKDHRHLGLARPVADLIEAKMNGYGLRRQGNGEGKQAKPKERTRKGHHLFFEKVRQRR